ncbi:MAG: hypothetical protein OXG05_00915 [Gammaproteobacteria bacterium]|nr:hypothetical protein [Gammaproteobacteria bacterium]
MTSAIIPKPVYQIVLASDIMSASISSFVLSACRQALSAARWHDTNKQLRKTKDQWRFIALPRVVENKVTTRKIVKVDMSLGFGAYCCGGQSQSIGKYFGFVDCCVSW